MHQSFVTAAFPKPGKCAVILLLHCLHNAEELYVFDRHRQPWQCSMITPALWAVVTNDLCIRR